jgi:hypothetical protein
MKVLDQIELVDLVADTTYLLTLSVEDELVPEVFTATGAEIFEYLLENFEYDEELETEIEKIEYIADSMYDEGVTIATAFRL